MRRLLLAVLLLLASVGTAHADDDEDVQGYYATVRLTYYLDSGLTYGGGHTYYGSAACSWNFPLGTRFMLPDGEVLVCNDRGRLGATGWLDVYARPDLPRAYGNYVTVLVLP